MGFVVAHDSEEPCGEYVIVNTCGFIVDAKEESINLILELGTLKKSGKIGKLMVMGCLSERYKADLPGEIPEVDKWYGKFDWPSFLEDLKTDKTGGKVKDWERSLTTPPWSAYLKISEGCDRLCAYCAIPIITGRHKSRPMEELLEEASALAASGVKELNIIAQDLSSYGLDLYGSRKLAELIDRMADIKGIEWIRLHYFYPTDFPKDILQVIKNRDNVCKYIDIALQHISDKVLGPMNRRITKEETLNLLKEIREAVPGIHIRTTIMTGFPGEDEEAFGELKEFVEEQKFERLGGFAYCEEEDTLAAKTYKDEIPFETKERRLSEIMEIQEELSLEQNTSKIGKTIKVLVEEKRDGYIMGRTEFDSPEVDQEVIVKGSKAVPGEFIKVEIEEAAPFELYGKEIID